jgi:carboxymethylenebutenolidase
LKNFLHDRLVEEAVYKFTHTIAMEWMLPVIPPTGKQIEVAVVGIIQFREGKIASEHLYWDQASVLVQLGLLATNTPAVAGVEGARTVLDPTLPSNELMRRI